MPNSHKQREGGGSPSGRSDRSNSSGRPSRSSVPDHELFSLARALEAEIHQLDTRERTLFSQLQIEKNKLNLLKEKVQKMTIQKGEAESEIAKYQQRDEQAITELDDLKKKTAQLKEVLERCVREKELMQEEKMKRIRAFSTTLMKEASVTIDTNLAFLRRELPEPRRFPGERGFQPPSRQRGSRQPFGVK